MATITFYHTPKASEVKEHIHVHNAATSLRVAHGAEKHTTLAKARENTVSHMTETWSELARWKDYIGLNFLHLYNCGLQLRPSHLKGGTWIGKISMETNKTAHLARALTGHVPIGAYRQWFLKEKDTYLCNCSLGKKTVNHVLRFCPLHVRRKPLGCHMSLVWVSNFLHNNLEAFGVFQEPCIE